jgi:hypothetical protein
MYGLFMLYITIKENGELWEINQVIPCEMGPWHAASSECGWRRWPPDVECSNKYNE